MARQLVLAVSVVILVLAVFVPSSQAVVYQPVPVGATTGYVEVYDPIQGVEYGKARIQYSYWRDLPSGYWYYAYQIFNNEFFGTPSDLNDDYHFGWLKLTTSSPTVYDTVNKFSVNLDPDNNGSGPSDLVILDTQAGSSAGGGPWGHSPDPNNRGVDWTVSLGSGTPLPIAPTRHQYVKVGKNWEWQFYADGQTSRNDATGQYFEIASRWAPGPTMAALTAYVDYEAGGLVMGPVVPEPSSLISLITISGFGGLAMLRRRRNR